MRAARSSVPFVVWAASESGGSDVSSPAPEQPAGPPKAAEVKEAQAAWIKALEDKPPLVSLGEPPDYADAGDRANNAVRIDASQLRARVVGEGGNLGLTQAARVEAALAGVEAALALGRLEARAAVPALLSLLRRNADQDAYLRHAAVRALERSRSGQDRRESWRVNRRQAQRVTSPGSASGRLHDL